MAMSQAGNTSKTAKLLIHKPVLSLSSFGRCTIAMLTDTGCAYMHSNLTGPMVTPQQMRAH